MPTRIQIDRTSTDFMYARAALMSDESLREYAKRRGFEGAVARRELARRDDEVTFAPAVTEVEGHA